MTGFNLPPGCEVHHIPGNRPEDIEYENFYNHVQKMLEESVGQSRAANFFEYIDKGDWEEVLVEYVDIAAGFAAAKAVMEAKEKLRILRKFFERNYDIDAILKREVSIRDEKGN